MVSQHFEQTHTYDCPRCHCATSVKRVASIHENPSYRHDFRFAPPVQPVEPSFLFWPITWGVVIETLTLIAVILLCASDHFSAGAYWLALVGICLPLILSAYAFRRMLKAERHSHTQFEWDEAYARWNQLLYCTADDVVFDPADQADVEQLPTTTSPTPIPLRPETAALKPVQVALAHTA